MSKFNFNSIFFFSILSIFHIEWLQNQRTIIHPSDPYEVIQSTINWLLRCDAIHTPKNADITSLPAAMSCVWKYVCFWVSTPGITEDYIAPTSGVGRLRGDYTRRYTRYIYIWRQICWMASRSPWTTTTTQIQIQPVGICSKCSLVCKQFQFIE